MIIVIVIEAGDRSPTVAVVFQLAEYAKTVTTIARMRKIDLNVHDPEPEPEELIANRVVAHSLKKQNDDWINAGHQRDVQRHWSSGVRC